MSSLAHSNVRTDFKLLARDLNDLEIVYLHKPEDGTWSNYNDRNKRFTFSRILIDEEDGDVENGMLDTIIVSSDPDYSPFSNNLSKNFRITWSGSLSNPPDDLAITFNFKNEQNVVMDQPGQYTNIIVTNITQPEVAEYSAIQLTGEPNMSLYNFNIVMDVYSNPSGELNDTEIDNDGKIYYIGQGNIRIEDNDAVVSMFNWFCSGFCDSTGQTLGGIVLRTVDDVPGPARLEYHWEAY